KMMRRATRYHAVRGLLLGVVLVALSATGWMIQSQIEEQNNAHHAAGLVQTLLKADTPKVLGIVDKMERHRHWTDPLLREEWQKAKPNSREQLHISLALLPVDASQVKYLYGRLLGADPGEVSVLQDALASHKEQLMDGLWTVATSPEKGKESQRLRA